MLLHTIHLKTEKYHFVRLMSIWVHMQTTTFSYGLKIPLLLSLHPLVDMWVLLVISISLLQLPRRDINNKEQHKAC